MRFRTPRNRSTLPWRGLALGTLLVCVVEPSCLNPRPDDFPSAAEPEVSDELEGVEVTAPEAPGCDQNPLLAICQEPGQAGNADDAADDGDDDPGDQPLDLEGDDEGAEPPDDADAGSVGVEPPDGDAPDAGPPSSEPDAGDAG